MPLAPTQPRFTDDTQPVNPSIVGRLGTLAPRDPEPHRDTPRVAHEPGRYSTAPLFMRFDRPVRRGIRGQARLCTCDQHPEWGPLRVHEMAARVGSSPSPVYCSCQGKRIRGPLTFKYAPAVGTPAVGVPVAGSPDRPLAVSEASQ